MSGWETRGVRNLLVLCVLVAVIIVGILDQGDERVPRVEAVGRDFGRHLPGVFWLNYYGPAYTNRIGSARFASLPTAPVTALGEGHIVRLAADPLTWTTPDYDIDERRVRDNLGRHHFFEKT